MGRAGERSREDAVSSVVGTVLMLGVTVSVFAAISIGVLAEFSSSSEKDIADLRYEARGGQAYLEHLGGDAVSLATGRLIVNVGGVETEYDLSVLDAQTATNGRWRIGEPLCLAGDGAGCLLPAGSDIQGVFLVVGNTLVLSQGSRGLSSGSAPPTAPDLVVSSLTMSPTQPLPGATVTWTAQIRNDGNAPTPDGVRVYVHFHIDGAVHNWNWTMGPLAPGASFTKTSAAWTATIGSHTLTAIADKNDLITESNEANNEATLAFTVTPGPADPGFAYEDVDGDGWYTAGTDTPIPNATIRSGNYDAGANGLVIPASVGAITAPEIQFSGAAVTVAIDLTAQSQDLQITSTGPVDLTGVQLTTETNGKEIHIQAGDLTAPNSTLDSRDKITVSVSGDAVLDGTQWETLNNGDNIDVTAAALSVRDATWQSRGKIVLAATTVDVAGADLATLNNAKNIEITASSSMTMTGAVLDSRGTIVLAGGDVDVSAATLTTFNNGDKVQVTGAGLTADAGTTITSRGKIQFDGTGTVALSGSTFETLNNNHDIDIDGGAVDLTDTKWTGRGSIKVTGSGDVDLSRATWTLLSSNENIVVDGVAITADDATLLATKNLQLRSTADLSLQRADLRSDNKLELDADGPTNTVFLQDAEFRDLAASPRDADVKPNGANQPNVVGTPAVGGWI